MPILSPAPRLHTHTPTDANIDSHIWNFLPRVLLINFFIGYVFVQSVSGANRRISDRNQFVNIAMYGTPTIPGHLLVFYSLLCFFSPPFALAQTLLIMYPDHPAPQNKYNDPVHQNAGNTVVAHHPYYRNKSARVKGMVRTPPAAYPGGTANATPSLAPPLPPRRIMAPYGLPILPPPSYPQLYNLPDPAPFIREKLQIPPGALIHLSSLVDESVRHTRPSYETKDLAAVAIYSSLDGKATQAQIRSALTARFEYFRTDNALLDTLKNALSASDLFLLLKPLPNDPVTRGGFWVVNVTNPTGHRARKRNTSSKIGSGTNSDVST
ncbi:uncharacterized protein BT62DRAFT_1012900 [Guyanagaster necrorhizus]|uniref:Fork-head domain-containing protein n=1 Tax=Guyanagaster necrorhizus TaxID=856835 RepID=A0A9P7VFZ9_9AGAR|nr:uncharacterized protein BT62DRAFT_1012900 [Guyanagaster necrorhizus MCA 3950]KAG7440248.1 hypothetical protein BT62DRAFT_1012900 [Guyanagaster necrorhizus MCA 3950]